MASAAGNRKHIRLLAAILLSGVALQALTPIAPAWAQETNIDSFNPTMPEDAKMLLSANELVYNRDAERVIVRGAVQINYGGYQMVAQQVEYSQKTGRIIATGEIELIEPGGNRVYADQMDVTDDFGNGFIEQLRVETTDLTKLAAVTGERRNGEEMILNNAVYTACTPCATNPDHKSLWHVKAQRIVQNGKTHTIRMENAKFELFGQPILYLPVLEVPDQTVKRKSGFLFPKIRLYPEARRRRQRSLLLGDLALYGRDRDGDRTDPPGLPAAGRIPPALCQWRTYSQHGRYQPAEPQQLHRWHRRCPGNQSRHDRLTGPVEINPRWTFGWDVLVQSDNNFARTYELSTFDGTTLTNQAYLTGLGKRNFFDARASISTSRMPIPTASPKTSRPSPRFWIIPTPILNRSSAAELTADINLTNINRNREDSYFVDVMGDDVYRFRGLEGTYHRLSADLEWKRNFIVPGGLSLTPILAARGDLIGSSMNDPTLRPAAEPIRATTTTMTRQRAGC